MSAIQNILHPLQIIVILTVFFISTFAVQSLHALEKNHYTIVTTIGMVHDLVDRVAGERAEVQPLIQPGLDPHLYKPTRNDVQSIMGADVTFYSGLMLEGKMTDLLVRAAVSGRQVFAVTELLDDDYLLQPEEFEGHIDPHVWNDPKAWMKAVEVIRDSLISFDPAAEEQYRVNAEQLMAEIAQVDAYAEKVLATIPAESRVLVTAHDAFNYFARRYNFEVMAIQGISTESEAGVKDIERLVKALVERNIKAVFVESTISDRNIRAVIEGAQAQGHTVTIGGELFADAMGQFGTYEGTFVGMVDHNATTIARALGGEAPKSWPQWHADTS